MMFLEERITRIEKDVAYLKEQFAYLRGIVEQMNKRLSRLENEVVHLRDEIRSQFRWTIGLILGMWVSVMCTLIPILLKLLGLL